MKSFWNHFNWDWDYNSGKKMYTGSKHLVLLESEMFPTLRYLWSNIGVFSTIVIFILFSKVINWGKYSTSWSWGRVHTCWNRLLQRNYSTVINGVEIVMLTQPKSDLCSRHDSSCHLLDRNQEKQISAWSKGLESTDSALHDGELSPEWDGRCKVFYHILSVLPKSGHNIHAVR